MIFLPQSLAAIFVGPYVTRSRPFPALTTSPWKGPQTQTATVVQNENADCQTDCAL